MFVVAERRGDMSRQNAKPSQTLPSPDADDQAEQRSNVARDNDDVARGNDQFFQRQSKSCSSLSVAAHSRWAKVADLR